MWGLRSRRGRPTVVEAVLAGLVVAIGVAELWLPFSSRQGSGDRVSNTATVVVVAAAMLWCRRRPLVPIIVVPLAWGGTALLFPTYLTFYSSFVPLLVGLFMAARYGGPRERWLGPVIVGASLLTIDLSVSLMQEPGEIAFHWTVATLVWCAATGLRLLEHRARESTRRAIASELAANTRAAQAVLEERTRIARELHDIVAHAMTSMVVQAGAAEQAVGDERFRSRALATIRETGVDALAEMRRLVSMLREGDPDGGLAPQPGLAALGDLVDRATATTGTAVSLTITGERRPLPAGLDLAAYRIVQEALTNVRKHAAATRCEVVVAYADGELRLDVHDDGHGTDSTRNAGGHGLIGMRERVALYGGEFNAGPQAGGGFAVSARLPLAVFR